MKYLKKFEHYLYKDRYYRYAIRQKVNLLSLEDIDKDTGFVVGNVYEIYQIDETDSEYTYDIKKLDSDDTVWVKEEQLRPSKPYEIDANKYNL